MFLAVFALGSAVLYYQRDDEPYPSPNQNPELHNNADFQFESDFSFDLPPGTILNHDNHDAKGWRQTGVMPLILEDAIDEVCSIMADGGFSLSAKQNALDVGDAVLLEFRSKNHYPRLWMLWDVKGTHTGFSWGVSK